MLETLDLKATVSKKEYREIMERLDPRLGEQQRTLREAKVPVVIVFDGWDAAGKGAVMSRLLQPLDPRGFKVHHVSAPDDRERLFPPMRRFWLRLPGRGTIGIFDHSWYHRVFEDRIEDGEGAIDLAHAYEQIRTFERQLADDGALIVKLFMHIDKAEQARRFKKLSKDPAFAWKVGKKERIRHKHYGDLLIAAEDMLRETSTAYAPWSIIPSMDERFATATVAETLTAAFDRALSAGKSPRAKNFPAAQPKRRSSPLDHADLTKQLTREKYEKALPDLQKELRRLQFICYRKRRPVLVVYEGWDAAGKGGNIKRLVRDLDPRGYEVAPFAAPTGEERAHPYLWRFWKALPKAGHFTIFDRSHYGRVMVERVEGFATPEEVERAYREINEFEEHLVEADMTVVKLWIHISKEEQLRRFKARQSDEYKQWKITDEDWRNRKKWDPYYEAVSLMIERTSTPAAPWTIIEGNDKLHARVQAIKTVIKRLKGELGEK